MVYMQYLYNIPKEDLFTRAKIKNCTSFKFDFVDHCTNSSHFFAPKKGSQCVCAVHAPFPPSCIKLKKKKVLLLRGDLSCL